MPLRLDAHREQVILRRVRFLARLLDTCFRVPGTRWRFGWDGIIGLIPVAGDLLTTLVALYIVWQAKRLGVPVTVLVQMLLNIAADLAGGTIPLAGDLVDMAWKANLRNVTLLEEWVREQRMGEGHPVIDV